MNATTKTVTIEYCTNDEWLVEFGGYEQDNSSDATAPSDEAKDSLERRMRALDAIDEVELVRAQGQRTLLHAWNGAGFTWRNREFGTFCEMDDELKRRIETALDLA